MARRRLRARVNWAVRWGGLAVSLVVTALIAFSFVRGISAYDVGTRTQCLTRLWRGIVELRVEDWRGPSPLDLSDFKYSRHRLTWFARPVPWPSAWQYEHKQRGTYSHTNLYRFPLWPIAAGGWTLTALVWWMSRGAVRVKAGACPSCRYDLSGLPPGSPCPECAAEPPAPPDG